MDNNEQNISLDELEALLLEGEVLKKKEKAAKDKIYREANKEKIAIKSKAYREAHKEEIAAYKKVYQETHKKEYKAYCKKHKERITTKNKVYHEQKAQELGFENHSQRRRYNRWCKENNIEVDMKNQKYLENIQYWINNIDNGGIKNLTKEEKQFKHKIYLEQKARELGFKNNNQRARYDRWCKENNIHSIMKNPKYLENISYWIENIDKKG